LHGHFPELEGGDLLIITGDLTARHTISEYKKFLDWFGEQKYTKKILVCGNHDPFHPITYDFEYLLDSGTEFEGLKIWGSPWTPIFDGINPKATYFTGSEEHIKKKFDLIPNDIDILITHGPPFGILDQTIYGYSVGSKSLFKNIQRLGPKLKIHVFSHIHEAYGEDIDHFTHYINCSHVNRYYKPENKPINIEL
jgi:Icc-related predicted phosphoesterase